MSCLAYYWICIVLLGDDRHMALGPELACKKH
jgi:hypothetical protein